MIDTSIKSKPVCYGLVVVVLVVTWAIVIHSRTSEDVTVIGYTDQSCDENGRAFPSFEEMMNFSDDHKNRWTANSYYKITDIEDCIEIVRVVGKQPVVDDPDHSPPTTGTPSVVGGGSTSPDTGQGTIQVEDCLASRVAEEDLASTALANDITAALSGDWEWNAAKDDDNYPDYGGVVVASYVWNWEEKDYELKYIFGKIFPENIRTRAVRSYWEPRHLRQQVVLEEIKHYRQYLTHNGPPSVEDLIVWEVEAKEFAKDGFYKLNGFYPPLHAPFPVTVRSIKNSRGYKNIVNKYNQLQKEWEVLKNEYYDENNPPSAERKQEIEKKYGELNKQMNEESAKMSELLGVKLIQEENGFYSNTEELDCGDAVVEGEE